MPRTGGLYCLRPTNEIRVEECQAKQSGAINRLMRCGLMAICLVLVACGAREAPPASGRIIMEYVDISESDVIVRLVNGSSSAIYVRAEYALSLDVVTWPSATSISCESIPPGLMIENPLPLADGASRRIQVSPGDHVRLKIITGIPQQYKGGRCHLTLRLDDGTAVGPIDFRP